MIRKAVPLAALLLIVPMLTGAVDWSNRVTRSATGGYVMGNPAANAKLVEFISYSCVHCARFTNQTSGAIRAGWVRRGTMSVEIRNAVRDKYDLTAAMLARCGGDRRFFGNHAALFANYDAWMKRVAAHARRPADPRLKNEVQVMNDIAQRTGLFALMQRRGFTRPQLGRCLADPRARATVLSMTDEAWNKLEIGGTPSFMLDGRLLEQVHDWDALRARLPGGSPAGGTTVSMPLSRTAG